MRLIRHMCHKSGEPQLTLYGGKSGRTTTFSVRAYREDPKTRPWLERMIKEQVISLRLPDDVSDEPYDVIRNRVIKECFDYMQSWAANNYAFRPEVKDRCDIENRAIELATEDMIEDLADEDFIVEWKTAQGWTKRVAELKIEIADLKKQIKELTSEDS